MLHFQITCTSTVDLQGGTLMHKVSQHMTSINKIYTDAQALKWALEIAGALEYLHLRNPAVFHRCACTGWLHLVTHVAVARGARFGNTDIAHLLPAASP